MSHELAPFVRRKPPTLSDKLTSSGLNKARLARTMRLVENTFAFTRGQDTKTVCSKGRCRLCRSTASLSLDRRPAIVVRTATGVTKRAMSGCSRRPACRVGVHAQLSILTWSSRPHGEGLNASDVVGWKIFICEMRVE